MSNHKIIWDIQSEQATLDTADGAIFHLTVIDTENPDRRLTTPSLDNNSTVQQANAHNSDNTVDEPTPEPTTQPEVSTLPAQPNLFVSMLPEIILLAVLLLAGAGVYFLRKKIKEG